MSLFYNYNTIELSTFDAKTVKSSYSYSKKNLS